MFFQRRRVALSASGFEKVFLLLGAGHSLLIDRRR
jgi:hypothetical protein